MAPLTEQLVKYLTDVHAMEVQALAQMRKAPELAGDPQLASVSHVLASRHRAGRRR